MPTSASSSVASYLEARAHYERARAWARSPAEERYLDAKIASCADHARA